MKNLSVVIIAKDEERNIEECLKNICKYEFEIVVVDTGSKDKTKEIAKKYTEKVYDFEWNNNFSEAKNFAIQKTENEIIFSLDCDEFVYNINKNELLEMIEKNPGKVGRIQIENELDSENQGIASKERVSRIFSKDFFYYTGRIHEQITSKKEFEFETYNAPLVCRHIGYNLGFEERKKKAERNIEILKLSISEKGENPYDLYQLAKGYFFKKDFSNAAINFSKAMEFDLNPRLEYVRDMIVSYGYSLLNNKRLPEALALESVYSEFKDSADYLFVMGLIYMQNAKFEKAISSFYEATKKEECVVEGVNSFSAYYNIGVIYECLGDKATAKKYYEKCGEYEKAKQRMKVIK